MLITYSDASLDEDSDVVGLGYVVKQTGENGHETLDRGIKAVDRNHHRGFLDVHAAEFEGVITAVRRSLDYRDGHDALLCYTDSRVVLNHLTRRDGIRHDKRFVHAALSFLGRYDNWNCSWLPSEHNDEAHGLARKARVFAESGYSIDVGHDTTVVA